MIARRGHLRMKPFRVCDKTIADVHCGMMHTEMFPLRLLRRGLFGLRDTSGEGSFAAGRNHWGRLEGRGRLGHHLLDVLPLRFRLVLGLLGLVGGQVFLDVVGRLDLIVLKFRSVAGPVVPGVRYLDVVALESIRQLFVVMRRDFFRGFLVGIQVILDLVGLLIGDVTVFGLEAGVTPDHVTEG